MPPKNLRNKIITVNKKPTITLQANPNDTVCPGSAVTLKASGAQTYSWNVSSSKDSVIVVYPTKNTTYSATGLNGSCAGKSVNITVLTKTPAPKGGVSTTDTLVFLSEGGKATFTPTGAVGSLFEWDFDGNGIIDKTESSPIPVNHTYQASGTYNAILSITLGSCTLKDTVKITVKNQPTVGIMDSSSLENSLELYPNPAKEEFLLKFNNVELSNFTVSIINMLGKVVYSEAFEKKLIYSKTFSTNPFNTGIYFVVITTENVSVAKKITVIK